MLSDSFGQLANIKAGSNDKHNYIYDAFGRRVAALQIIDNDPAADEIEVGRRRDGKHSWWRDAFLARNRHWTPASHPRESRFWAFASSLGLYDGSMVATEYIFKAETGEIDEVNSGYTTLTNGYAELERIYVRGSILFCAIDHDQDSTLTNINDISECNWAGGLSTVCNDHAFYYYASASGEFAALGHKADDQKILEYYRNRVFGEVVALPVVDEEIIVIDEGLPIIFPKDGIEDSPADLTDNNSKMMTNRGLNGDYVGRVSEYGNVRVSDSKTWCDVSGIQFQAADKKDEEKKEPKYKNGDSVQDLGNINDGKPDGDWRKQDPIKARGPCPNGFNKIGPVVIHHDIDVDGADDFAKAYKFVGSVRNISDLITMLRNLTVEECTCIDHLILIFHGWSKSEGGIRAGSDKNDDDDIMDDGEGQDSVSGAADAKLFGGIIKGALCKDAKITLMACWSVAGEFGKELAKATGATIVGGTEFVYNKDSFTYVVKDGARVYTYSGWALWEGGRVTIKPDGTVGKTDKTNMQREDGKHVYNDRPGYEPNPGYAAPE